MIQEIMAQLEDKVFDVTFRMDSGYFDEELLKTIKALGCRYVIKAKRLSDTGCSGHRFRYRLWYR
jgi:hypothetical protein